MNWLRPILVTTFLVVVQHSCGTEIPQIKLAPFVTGLKYPTSLTDDGTGRLFVTEQDGTIRLVDHGVLQTQPYLDLTTKVSHDGTEHGLKCVVFHPQFAKNGRLFVNYVVDSGSRWEVVVSEFKADPAATKVDPATERVIWHYAWPTCNHFGGQLAFGPDGMLYGASDPRSPDDLTAGY